MVSIVYHKRISCRKCLCSQTLPEDLQVCSCECHPADRARPVRSRDYRIDLLDRLKDRNYAAEYLSASVEDGDLFRLALMDICEAWMVSQ